MFSPQTYLSLKNLKGIGPKKILQFRHSLFFNEDLTDPLDKNDFIDLVQAHFGVNEKKDILNAWIKAQESIQLTEELDIKVIGYDDSEYPKKFKDPNIKSPLVLFVKGEVATLNQKTPYVAVVGSRKATKRGLSVARKVANFLAERKIVVVSGLALGCDTQGHIGAIEKSGTTIAVLAHGLDQIRPKENTRLTEEILSSGGSLITEYEINTEVLNYQYAERNRLQSGLSDLVFVVDTGLEGGTQQTIKYAIEQNKELACRKPREDEKDSQEVQGNLKLIKSGFKGIVSSEDLQELLSTL